MRQEKDGTRTVLAKGSPEGKRFNGPNDVAIKSDGAIYFTDSVFGMRGGADSPARELPYNGFFLIKLLAQLRSASGMTVTAVALRPLSRIACPTFRKCSGVPSKIGSSIPSYPARLMASKRGKCSSVTCVDHKSMLKPNSTHSSLYLKRPWSISPL